jgi:aspartate ammonia-lyase
MRTGKGILELVRKKKVLTEAQIRKVLDPRGMIGTRRET